LKRTVDNACDAPQKKNNNDAGSLLSFVPRHSSEEDQTNEKVVKKQKPGGLDVDLHRGHDSMEKDPEDRKGVSITRKARSIGAWRKIWVK